MIKTKKQMFIVIGAFVLIMLLGTASYAFFNFTRTGGENSLGTGRIYFNTTETRTVSLTQIFPVDENDLDPSTLASTSVRIVGDTTYSGGEEYLVTLTDIHNTINNKTVPIHYIATYTASSGKTVGTESNDYFNDRGSTSNVYTLSEEGVVTEGERILIGFLKEGETGIDGILTIKAWISNDDVAISDTYDGTESDNMGTTTEWVGNRVVVTTTEWNGFMGNGALSFKIKTESNEGTWVRESNSSTPAAVPTMAEMCPGCLYGFNFGTLNFGENGSVVQVSEFEENYEDVIEDENNDAFFGIIIDNESGKVSRVFACGLVQRSLSNDKIPFCVEGAQNNDQRFQEIYESNVDILNTIWGIENCQNNGSDYSCSDVNESGISMATSAADSFIEYYDQYGKYDSIYADQPGRAEFRNDW